MQGSAKACLLNGLLTYSFLRRVDCNFGEYMGYSWLRVYIGTRAPLRPILAVSDMYHWHRRITSEAPPIISAHVPIFEVWLSASEASVEYMGCGWLRVLLRPQKVFPAIASCTSSPSTVDILRTPPGLNRAPALRLLKLSHRSRERQYCAPGEVMKHEGWENGRENTKFFISFLRAVGRRRENCAEDPNYHEKPTLALPVESIASSTRHSTIIADALIFSTVDPFLQRSGRLSFYSFLCRFR
ncbi:hypothetical protein BDQ17DRAFT_1081840 [Cyathus striatus]|nr:hypothetical protein BDQ17DRAFT_1081840 [Cyathus striatus]